SSTTACQRCSPAFRVRSTTYRSITRWRVTHRRGRRRRCCTCWRRCSACTLTVSPGGCGSATRACPGSSTGWSCAGSGSARRGRAGASRARVPAWGSAPALCRAGGGGMSRVTGKEPRPSGVQYKRLWMVEQWFRACKSLLATRPIYHQRDETIRGHVFCSFLALLLRHELQARLQVRGHGLEWAEVIEDLER